MTLKTGIVLTLLILSSQAWSHREAALPATDKAAGETICNKIIAEVAARRDPRLGYNSFGEHQKPPIENFESAFSLVNGMVNGRGLARPPKEILAACIPKIAEIYQVHRANIATEIEMARQATDSAGEAGGDVIAKLTGGTRDASHSTASACEVQLFSSEDCDTSPAASNGLNVIRPVMNGIAEHVPVIRFSADDCACADQKFRNNRNSRTPGEMVLAKNDLQKQINETLLRSYGKKFINDYAANLEDLNYFLGEKSTVFEVPSTTAQSEKVNEGLKYQCNQEQGYQQKIEEACKDSSVLPAEREERKKALISAWGQSPAQNFNAHMEQIGIDVLTIKTKPTSTLAGAPYSRARYDAFRAAQVKTLPGVIFADRLTAKILSTPDLLTKFKELAQTKTVQEALVDLIAKEAPKANSFVSELLNDPIMGNTSFVADFRNKLKGQKASDIRIAINSSFSQASSNHPGFELLLNDQNKLNDLSFSPNETSIISRLESENAGGFIDQKFRERCDILQKEFAKVVCTDPDKLMSNFKPEEIDDAISHENPSLLEDVNIYNKLICENKTQNAAIPLSPFHLSRNQQADYLGRLKDPLNSPDRFSQHMRDETENPQSSAAVYISQTTNARLSGVGIGAGRVSINNSGRIGNAFSSEVSRQPNGSTEESLSQFSTAPVKTDNIIANNATRNVTREEVNNDSAVQANYNNLAVPTSGAVIPPVTDNGSGETNKKDSRSELRESLTDANNKDQVEKLISNIDDPAARELSKLREEALSNQKKILELSSEAERKKLQDIEKRISDLQSARNVAARNQSNESDDGEESDSNKPKRKTTKFDGRESASVDGSLDNLAGSQSFSPSGVNSGSLAGSGSATSGRASVANDARDASSAIKPIDTNSGALIISSNAVFSQGQEIKPIEMNNELLKYLTQSEPDISTLMNIKTSGMVYKFKVMENGQYVEKEVLLNYDALNPDIKTLIDQKIASRRGVNRSLASIDQEISFLKRTHSFLSLKLIIDEQTRQNR